MWLSKLKIAIIEKNTDAMNALLDDLPELHEAREIEEAIYLLKEGTKLLTTLKDETQVAMGKIQKNLSFLRSTEKPSSNKLDLKS